MHGNSIDTFQDKLNQKKTRLLSSARLVLILGVEIEGGTSEVVRTVGVR